MEEIGSVWKSAKDQLRNLQQEAKKVLFVLLLIRLYVYTLSVCGLVVHNCCIVLCISAAEPCTSITR